ncbi:hypothetical protein ACF1A5_29275 [Streptomyces sp. NPDC014864]|uniref:hypothetical protein n=1 Tax=Streptomyces sp. NPDC014864 TaxID=3364924 RepID=UPI0036F57B21
MSRRHLRALSLAVPVLILSGLTATASAQPGVYVPCNDVAALDAAIIAANNNTGPNTIRLAPRCVYTISTPASTGGLGPNALPQITGTVTLLGRDTTIRRDPDASTAFRIAEIDGSGGHLTLEGITATNGGYLDYAGAFMPLSGATLTLRHSAVTNNIANQGGAIFVNQSSHLEIFDSVLSDNSSQQGGAIYNGPGSTTRLSGVRLEENHAAAFGGALFDAGNTLTVDNSTISRNSAFYSGGGIYNDRHPMQVTSTRIESNHAGLIGGGIYNAGTSTLTDSVVQGNSANTGGGIYQDTLGIMTLVRSRVVHNTPNNCRPIGTVPHCPDDAAPASPGDDGHSHEPSGAERES